jgi:hypothetical protein
MLASVSGLTDFVFRTECNAAAALRFGSKGMVLPIDPFAVPTLTELPTVDKLLSSDAVDAKSLSDDDIVIVCPLWPRQVQTKSQS